MMKIRLAPHALTLLTFASLVSLPPQALGSESCDAASQLVCYCKSAGLGEGSIAGSNNPVAPCYVSGYQNPSFLLFGWMSAFSWSALNWPVDPDTRLPDYGRDLKKVKGDSVPYWHYWKSASEVFLPDGREPSPWGSGGRMLPESCRNLDRDEAQADYAHINVPDAPPRLLSDYVNAEKEILVDRNGKLVRYETVMNKSAFQYIVDNNLYNTDGQEAFSDPTNPISFPSGGGPDDKIRGSYFLKAAWKVISADERSDDLHKSWAYLYPVFRDGELIADCELHPVGLLGLHVTYKVKVAPEWAWATFEHNRIAPRWEEVKLKPKAVPAQADDYLLFNRRCIAGKSCAPLNTEPALFKHGRTSSPLPTNLVMQQDYGYGYACTNTGSNCDDADVQHINQLLVSNLKTSVWQNYRLKGTQWIDTLDENRIKPRVLANTSIEPYIQSTSSCLSCHMPARVKFTSETGHPIPNATHSDNIFVLQKAKPKMTPLTEQQISHSASH